MKKLIAFLLLAAVLTAGCNKKDSVTYSGIEAGTLGSGVFTSDIGTRMYVVSNESNLDVSRSRRAVIQYETHPITDPNHLEINLISLLDAIIREPSPADALDNNPAGSPIEVADAWFSGGYLNLLVGSEGKDYDKHLCSAAYMVNNDGIVIRLLHQNDEGKTSAANSPLKAFLSLPMNELQQAYEQHAKSIGKKQTFPVTVTLQWTSTTLDGGSLTLNERKGSYSPAAAN